MVPNGSLGLLFVKLNLYILRLLKNLMAAIRKKSSEFEAKMHALSSFLLICFTGVSFFRQE